MLTFNRRGQEPGPAVRLQIHRDIRQIAHQRGQCLLRHRARDPEIQQRHVRLPGCRRRQTTTRQDGDGRRRPRCRLLQQVRGDVRRNSPGMKAACTRAKNAACNIIEVRLVFGYDGQSKSIILRRQRKSSHRLEEEPLHHEKGGERGCMGGSKASNNQANYSISISLQTRDHFGFSARLFSNPLPATANYGEVKRWRKHSISFSSLRLYLIELLADHSCCFCLYGSLFSVLARVTEAPSVSSMGAWPGLTFIDGPRLSIWYSMSFL